MLSAFDVGKIAPEALLFQTGYLTIHSCSEPMPGYWVYTLGYPNREVESSLNAALIGAYGVLERFSSTARLQLIDLLKQRNFTGLRDVFQSFLPEFRIRGIPETLFPGTKDFMSACSTVISQPWGWTSGRKNPQPRAHRYGGDIRRPGLSFRIQSGGEKTDGKSHPAATGDELCG